MYARFDAAFSATAPRRTDPARIYRALAGVDIGAADIAGDTAFDRHVVACALALAWSDADDGDVAGRLGLPVADLVALVAELFPHGLALVLDHQSPCPAALDEEAELVRDLLLAHRVGDGPVTRALAAVVARRAMEPNHLWEDLGLRNRAELSRLLARHFGALAARNTRDMRWKRFLYRALCEAEGAVLCTAPVCSRCPDVAACFGPEAGESRLERARRDMACDKPDSATSGS